MLGRWVDGMNNSLTNRLMFQALLFFIIYRLRALKSLYFHSCKNMKKKNQWKYFLHRILQKITKKILGNSKRLVDELFVPVTQRIILKIVRFKVICLGVLF